MIYAAENIGNLIDDLKIIGIVTVFVLFVIFFPEFLEKKKKISKFVARKIVHSFSGLAIIVTPYLNYPILAGILALFLTLFTRTSGRKSPTKLQRNLFESIYEEEEIIIGYLQGPYAYCLAITLLVFIFIPFPELYYFPITAVLIMMYSRSQALYIA